MTIDDWLRRGGLDVVSCRGLWRRSFSFDARYVDTGRGTVTGSANDWRSCGGFDRSSINLCQVERCLNTCVGRSLCDNGGLIGGECLQVCGLVREQAKIT